MTQNPGFRSLARTRRFACAGGGALFRAPAWSDPSTSGPSAAVPPAFKEPPPPGWKEAQPNDGAHPREMVGDLWRPALNALEEQVSVSNQNVLAAEAQFRAARDAVRIARSRALSDRHAPARRSPTPESSAAIRPTASVPARATISISVVDFSYQADVWGSIRRTVTASAETAQATAAQLENARSAPSGRTGAWTTFSCTGSTATSAAREHRQIVRRVSDADQEPLCRRRRQRRRRGAGRNPIEYRARSTHRRGRGARTVRTRDRHADRTGRRPRFPSHPMVLGNPPPPIPVAMPSALLERRPDVAAAERQMAMQNEQIGIATGCFLPFDRNQRARPGSRVRTW